MTTESNTNEKKVLLIGGTGDLGGMIARALLERGASLRLYVRPGSRSKLPSDLKEAAEIVEDESQAFTGMDVVISAIQGGSDVIVDKQLEFLAAAKEAGVK
ncbi:MAG: NmrA family NAD(P)-binding protein, partial [Thermosynechococcaceae cyanobacterium]